MTRPQIGIVGGGLAGLSAAIACGDAGAQATLFEARPRLGGATWSSERDGWSNSSAMAWSTQRSVWGIRVRPLSLRTFGKSAR